MKKKSAIGILGGMGPEASVYMYKMLIDLSIKHFNAKNNDEFPEIVLYSIPVPDFISSDKHKEEALFMLKERVRQLEYTNLSCLSIACNTAHIFLKDLQKVISVPFISMVEEVIEQVEKDGQKIVGLMGTPSTIRYQLYQSALQAYDIETIVPNNKKIDILEDVIRNVLKGKINKREEVRLKNVADSLKKRGAEGIILGCTELPLVFPLKYELPVYNSLEILAMALLRKYYK